MTAEIQREDGETFKVEDLVQVVKRPRPDYVNHLIDSMHYWGFIEEFREYKGEPYIQLYCLDGNGMGPIPLACISHYDTPESRQAKLDFDAKIEQGLQAVQDLMVQAQEAKDYIADRLDLAPETVDAVLDLWNKRKPRPA